VRVTTAFNRLLLLGGASVIDVSFALQGVIVTVRLRRRRRVCSGCGQTGRHLQIHEHRVKRWRHLDLGSSRCIIECELRRLRCPDCGVRYEGCRGRADSDSMCEVFILAPTDLLDDNAAAAQPAPAA